MHILNNIVIELTFCIRKIEIGKCYNERKSFNTLTESMSIKRNYDIPQQNIFSMYRNSVF